MAGREPLDIIGGFYRDENLHWSDQDVLNYLPITAEKKGTRTVSELRQAPGLRPLVDIYTVEGETIVPSGPVRGMRNVEGRLFVVAGRGLYEITTNYVCIPRGIVPGVDLVSMDHNQNGAGNQLSIDNGSARYVYHTATEVFQKVVDTGFPGSSVSFYIDGYMGYVDPSGQRWGHSGLKNALEYNDIDRYTAEGLPDGIVTAAVSHREVLIFGSQTIEPYVNTGAATGTFKRASNTVIECGCAAPRSVASMDNSLMWLDDQLLIRRLDGYNPVRVSTNGIEQALAEYPLQQVSRAFSYAWEDRGHKVYYITVPGGHTFGLDALSGEWHRRASSTSTRLRFNALVKWNGMWVGGDYQSGRLYQVDWRYFMDGCDPLVRRRRTGVLSNNQNPVGVNELEFLFNVGGPESVCAEFPDQPSGPQVSGALPDGSVGLSWAGGTYTATGGTPPYTFTSRPGSTFPGNLGPMSTAGVVAVETPTTAGAGVNIVRATDANGLYDELTDNFIIGETTAMLGVAASNFFLIGPGGTDWDNAYTYAGAAPALQAAGMIGGGGFWVNWSASGTDNPRYSTDATGTAWVTSAAAFDVNTRTPNGDYADGVFLIPATNGIYRSADHCISLTKVSTVPTYAIAMSDDYAVAIDASQTTCLVAPNPYTTFTAGVAHGVSLSSGSFIKKGGERFLVGGQVAPGGLPKAVFVNADGTGLAAITLPTLSVGYVSAAAYDPTGERWVIGTSAGQLCYMAESDGIWHLSASTLPGDFGVRSLEWNGAVFAGCGTDNAAASTDYVKYSTLGVTWILAPTLAAVRPAMIKVMR